MCVCESDCSALQKDNNYHSTSLHLHDQLLAACIFLQLTFSLSFWNLPSILTFPLNLLLQRSLMISSCMMSLFQWTLSNFLHLEGFSSFAISILCFVGLLPPFCSFCFSFALLQNSHPYFIPLTHYKSSSWDGSETTGDEQGTSK